MRAASYSTVFLGVLALCVPSAMAQPPLPPGPPPAPTADVAEKIQKLLAAAGADRLPLIDALGDAGAAAAAAAAPLASLVADADEETRIHAARALGAIGPAAVPALPALVKATEDSSPRVKAYALYAIGMIGESAQSASSAVVARITDPDAVVRREAVKAIRRLRLPVDQALPLFLNVLESTNSAAEVLPALHSLAEVGKAGVPRLIEGMKHPEARYWICRILAEIGPDAAEAVPALTEALSDERPETRREAVLALGHIGAASGPAAAKIASLTKDTDAGTRAAVIWTLVMSGAPAADIVAAAKPLTSDSDELVRLVAAWAVTKHQPDDTAGRTAAVELFLTALQGENPRLRAVAARSLVDLRTGDLRVAEALVDAMGDEAVAGVVHQALAEMKADAVPRLIKALERPKLRGYAVATLGRLGPAAADSIKNLLPLTNDSDRRIRIVTLQSLAMIAPQNSEVQAALTAALTDKSSDVRLAAVEALGVSGSAGTTARAAIEKLSDDPDPTVRDAVKYVLATAK